MEWLGLLKELLEKVGLFRKGRRRARAQLERVRHEIQRSGHYGNELLTKNAVAPAYRLPVVAWTELGGTLTDDVRLTPDEHRDIDAYSALVDQVNLALDEAALAYPSVQTNPTAGALLFRPAVKARHLFEGRPSAYDKALAAIATAIGRL